MIGAPTLARIKRACRAAIGLSGGIDGAAATTGKARATCGNWNNRNMADTPTLADAFLLDEVAVMARERPPILAALAGELGCVVIVLPEAGADGEALSSAFMDAAAEFGDVSQRLREALSDGRLDAHERPGLLAEIDEAQAALATLRHLAAGEPVRAVASNERGAG